MDLNDHGRNSTYAEIIRQQVDWERTLRSLRERVTQYHQYLEVYQNHIWVFVGCGTSYYLSQTASRLFTMITGIQSLAVPASEILIFTEAVFHRNGKYLMVPISRSGATTEIVLATQKAQGELKIPTLAVSCDSNSKLVKTAKLAITFPFEQEKSVVMTSSFTTMLLSILYLALLRGKGENTGSLLDTLPAKSRAIAGEVEPLIKEICRNHDLSDFIFLGHGPLYGIANEAALKMQEMSISESQSYHTLEYRHGPNSTAAKHTLITILLSNSGKNLEYPLVNDLKKLGAKLLVLEASSDSEIKKVADYYINVGTEYGDIFKPFLYMPVLHLLGYYRAIAKGINPDSPRNLTAVVELEL